MDTMMLPVPLTKHEIDQFKDELAELVQLQIEAQSAEGFRKTQFKKQQTQTTAKIQVLAGTIKRGTKEQAVEIRRVKNFQTGTLEIYRQDTGELVLSRQLTPEERQLSLEE